MGFFYSDEKGIRFGRIILALIGVAILIWLLVAAIWGFGVATAGLYGKGEVYRKTHSADLGSIEKCPPYLF